MGSGGGGGVVGIVKSVVLGAILGAATGGIGSVLFGIGEGAVFGLEAGLMSAVASGAAMGAIGGALSGAMALLAPKPPSDDSASFDPTRSNAGQAINQRAPVKSRKIAYGRVKGGDLIPFMHAKSSSGSTKNEYLYFIVVLAAHEIDAVEQVYFNNSPVSIDGAGAVTTAPYNGYAWVNVHLGEPGQTADATFLSDIPDKWTAQHKGQGIAYLAIKLKYDTAAFANGVPNVSAVFRGKKVYDPRTGLTAWSDNAALCTRDYLLTAIIDGGFGASASEVSDIAAETAASICDETVSCIGYASTFTSDASTEILALDFATTLDTGDAVYLRTTGTLPAPLESGTPYYWISLTTTTGKLATSAANASAGTAINLTNIGTGIHTLVAFNATEARYTINGWIDTSQQRGSILEDMLSSMGGRIVPIEGKLEIHAAAWMQTSLYVDESWSRGAISVQARRPLRELTNSLTAEYMSPSKNWQPSTTPPVTNAIYVARDNGQKLPKSIRLPFTTSGATAQRLAKIELERVRRQKTISMPCNLKGLQAKTWDVVAFSNDAFHMGGETFRVTNWGIGQDFGTSLTLSEDDSDVYAWNPLTDEQVIPPSPSTDLPDPSVCAPPSGLTLSSGPSTILIASDGTVKERILAQWTASPDSFITLTEMHIKKSADADVEANWSIAALASAFETKAYAAGVSGGVAYDVRIRVINSAGVPSTWVTETGHVVNGDTSPPAVPTGLMATAGPGNISITWTTSPDSDFSQSKLWVNTSDTPGTATVLTSPYALRSTSQVYTHVLGSGQTRYYWVSAVDKSGNESDKSTSVTATAA